MTAASHQDPRVSVVISTFNRSNVLKFAVESVCAQSYSNWELLVVGDGCTDDTAEVVAQLQATHPEKTIRWIPLDTNSGSQGVPNNAGVSQGDGEFVAFLGHDDLWFPWHLETLVQTMLSPSPLTPQAKTGQVNFGHALTAGFGPEGLRTVWGEPRTELGYRRHYVPPSSWMLTKDFFHKVGQFRTARNLVLPVDADLVDRAAKQGSVFACTRRISVVKFPSAWFDRPYSGRFANEQSNFWDSIREDATSCEQRLLNDVLLRFALTSSGGFPKPHEALTSAVGLVKHSVWQSAVGSDRIDFLVQFRRRRAIDATRRIRGLPPL